MEAPLISVRIVLKTGSNGRSPIGVVIETVQKRGHEKILLTTYFESDACRYGKSVFQKQIASFKSR